MMLFSRIPDFIILKLHLYTSVKKYNGTMFKIDWTMTFTQDGPTSSSCGLSRTPLAVVYPLTTNTSLTTVLFMSSNSPLKG